MEGKNHPTWAIAGLALFGRHTAPLFIRIFTSPRDVLEHPDGATCANLYVGEEDVVRLHFLLFSSLDRCDDIVQERLRQKQQGGGSGGAARVSSGADVRFLGRLMRSHMFVSYGFQSATGIRTILAIIGDVPLDAVLPLCRATYEAASAALCNPFSGTGALFFLRRGGHVEVPAGCEEIIGGSPTLETSGEEGPSLAHSRSFNEQLRKVIEPFTATTLSHMV